MNHSIRSLLFAEGRALLRGNRADEAAGAFERALKEAGNSPSTTVLVEALADAYRATKSEYALRMLVSYAAGDSTQDVLLTRAGEILNPAAAVLVAPLIDTEWQWLVQDEPARTLLPRLLFAVDVCMSARQHEKAYELLTRARRLATESLQRQEIGQRLYEIGRRLNSADDLTRSEAVLRDAVDLAPDHTRSRWLLSEILRRRSYPENSAELARQGQVVGEADIKEALRVWADAAAQGEAAEAWALSSRASLNEQLAKLRDADQWILGWEAVVYALRAMLARGSDIAGDSSTLARCYRALDLRACELTLVKRGADLASTADEKQSALEELLITSTNAGEFDEALKVIGELGQSPWTDAVKAFVRTRQGAPDEALELVERAIAEGYQEAWCFDLRLLCYRETGPLERFWQACETTWSEAGEDDETLERRARAGLFLALRSGAFDDVTRVVARYSRSKTPTDLSPDQLQGLLALAKGDVEPAATHLRRSISLTTSRRDLEDLRRDLRFIETHLPASAQRATSLFKQVEEWMTARAAELATGLPGPERELEELLRTRPDTDAAGWLWIAANVTLAQFDVWGGRFEAAAARYVSVLERAEAKVPEARSALDGCGRELLNRAVTNLADAASADARASSIRLCEWLTQQAPLHGRIRGNAWTALMFAHALGGEIDRARSAFHAAKKAYDELGYASTPASSGPARTLIRRASDFWKIWDAVVTIVPMAYERRTFEEELITWFGTTYTTRTQPDELEWWPIILELGAGLIPENAHRDYQSWALFKTYLPELREWFVEKYGVRIGAIRVRGNANLAHEQYAILIDEVPVQLANNAVRLDASFVAAPRRSLVDARVAPDHIEDVRHPFSGKRCCWVAAPAQAALRAAGLATQEPLQFVVEHLKKVLCRHLHEYVGPDAVDMFVSEQCQTPEQQALANEVLPTATARFRFSRLLRALVRDGVPVTGIPEVLEAVRGVHLHPTARDAAIETVRLRLRSRLPGNGEGWRRVAVAPEVEHAIVNVIAKPGDGGAAARVDAAIRAILANAAVEEHEGVALTTANHDAAAYLRRVLPQDPWQVTALCQQEVYEPVAATVSSAAS